MRARNARRLTRGRLAGLGKKSTWGSRHALSGNSIIETVSLIESPFFRLPDRCGAWLLKLWNGSERRMGVITGRFSFEGSSFPAAGRDQHVHGGFLKGREESACDGRDGQFPSRSTSQFDIFKIALSVLRYIELRLIERPTKFARFPIRRQQTAAPKSQCYWSFPLRRVASPADRRRRNFRSTCDGRRYRALRGTKCIGIWEEKKYRRITMMPLEKIWIEAGDYPRLFA